VFAAENKRTEERRRYFRIEDEIILFYRKVSPEQVARQSDATELAPDCFSLSAELDFLTQESRLLLRRIERTLPEVADFLKTLDKKVNLIAQKILLDESHATRQTTRAVDISGSGLAFDSEKPLETDVLLELKMILPPEFVGVVVHGKIVYCKENAPGDDRLPYRLGVDFLSIREQDREMLIRHIFKREMRHLRERQ
jgi:hypothetical protein